MVGMEAQQHLIPRACLYYSRGRAGKAHVISDWKARKEMCMTLSLQWKKPLSPLQRTPKGMHEPS